MPDEARDLKYWEDHDWVIEHAPWAKTMVALGWHLRLEQHNKEVR